MAFFKTRTDAESVKDSDSGGNYITKSGMYDLVIKHVIVRTNEHGAQSIDLIVNNNGTEQTIYRAFALTNNDGSANFSQQLFNRFCIVAGGEQEGFEIEDPIKKSVMVNRKTETYEEVDVLPQFEDSDLKMTFRIQQQFRRYMGEIKPRMVIKNVFRFEDKASAQEIVNHVEPKGQQYEKELAIADKDEYRDGITQEEAIESIRQKIANRAGQTQQEQPKRRFSNKPVEKTDAEDIPF